MVSTICGRADWLKVVYVAPYPLRVWTPEPYYYAKHLKKLGHDVQIIAPKGGDSTLFSALEIPVHQVPGSVGWYWGVGKALNQISPDIVHVFKHLGCSLLPRFFHRMDRPKFVVDIRSPLLHGPMINTMVAVKDQLEFLAFDAICSNTVETMNGGSAKGKSIHYLPNGVDCDELPPLITSKSSHSPFHFVYVGAINHKRKVGTWLQAFTHVSQHSNIRLDLFGRGTDREFRSLARLIGRLNSSQKIKLSRPIPRRELFARLGKDYDAAIACLPKVPFDTGPPLKTLEYLACGLPVLATDTQGNRLYVTHRVNGLIVDESPGSVEQGILDMIDLVKSTDNLREICCNSVAGITWDHSIRRYLVPLYQELLA